MIPIIILILFILTAGITFYRIQIGFSLIIALQMIIPPNVRLIGLADLQIHNALILTLLAKFTLEYLKNNIKKQQKTKVFLKPYLVLIIGLISIVFFASTLDFTTHIKNLLFVFSNGFVLSIIAFYIFETRKDIDRFFVTIAAAALIATLYGVFCYVTLTNPYIKGLIILYPGMDALSFMEEARGGLNGRIQSTTLHPLIWGGLCLLLFFILRNNIKNKITNTFLLSLLFLNIVFSGSRSTLLSLIIGIIYLFIYSGTKFKKKYLFYAIILFSISITAIYQVPSLKKYSAIFESTIIFWNDDKAKDNDFKGSTFEMRTTQLYGTFEMIEDNVLTGLGQGYVQYYQEKYGVHPLLQGFDSMIFIVLINSGIIGLLLWLYFFYLLFNNIKLLNKTKNILNQEEYISLRNYVIVFFIFIIFTGFQNLLSFFMTFYAIQYKNIYLRQY